MDVRWPRTRLSAKFVLSDAAGDAVILVNWCRMSLLMISIYILFELFDPHSIYFRPSQYIFYFLLTDAAGDNSVIFCIF